jgi:hypothetical protein
MAFALKVLIGIQGIAKAAAIAMERGERNFLFLDFI